MANINDLQKYCTIHSLLLLQGAELATELGEAEVEDDIVAMGFGGHPTSGILPVIILKDDGEVQVLKAWSNSPTQNDVWATVTDEELMLGHKGFRLHAL